MATREPSGQHRLRLRGLTVLAVFAHPDDESLACGGTLARLSDMGASVVLLCASRGERGFVQDASLAPEGDLGAVRTRELHAAADVLGVGAVRVLEYPDGNLCWGAGTRLRTDIVQIMRQCNPQVVITFDDDGLYWHADHISVYEQTLNATSSLGTSAPALYYVTMAPGAMHHVARRAMERGWAPPSAGLWSIDPWAFGAAAHAATLVMDIRPWITRKLAALQCHRTQMGLVNPFVLLDPADTAKWLGFEYFRRAPIAGQRQPVLEGLAARPVARGATFYSH